MNQFRNIPQIPQVRTYRGSFIAAGLLAGMFFLTGWSVPRVPIWVAICLIAAWVFALVILGKNFVESVKICVAAVIVDFVFWFCLTWFFAVR